MAEDKNAQRVVDLHLAILRSKGITLTPADVILDFGCGSGRHTYEYSDAGFTNTFGYDVKNYVSLRSPSDANRFRFGGEGIDEAPPNGSVPWPDNTFDFVFATSVFEHVLNQEHCYREIVRILKPGGIFLNDFPSKWKPVEPHIYVPFGGTTKSLCYFKFWARLGIRNEFQRGLTAAETAERNHFYALHGINYL
jgi:SAM-dependent methyltransferase